MKNEQTTLPSPASLPDLVKRLASVSKLVGVDLIAPSDDILKLKTRASECALLEKLVLERIETLERQRNEAVKDSDRILILAYNPDYIDIGDYDEDPEGLRKAIDDIDAGKAEPVSRKHALALDWIEENAAEIWLEDGLWNIRVKGVIVAKAHSLFNAIHMAKEGGK